MSTRRWRRNARPDRSSCTARPPSKACARPGGSRPNASTCSTARFGPVSRPSGTTGDIGHAIQTYVEAQHMSVVRDFCGHGLGRLFHDEPNIVHVGRPGEGIVLRPGMFFTVEPMINLGRPHVKVLSDGWTAVTRDRSLSAQFEHTVAVTEDGVEIFTLSPQGLDRPGPAPAPRA